jgi:hypothetical protein
MLKLSKAVGIIALCTTSSLACAHIPYFNAPYVGVEVIQTSQDYKQNYGKEVFKKNPQDYNIFGGFKFWRFLGIEAGFEWQPKRNKNVDIGPGETLPGGDPTILTSGETAAVSSNIRGVHPYVGLFAELDQVYCCLGKIKYQALIAASFSYIKATDSLDSILGATTPGLPYVEDYAKHRIVPLVKLSAGHNFTRNFGARVLVDYRNTSEFKIKQTNGAGYLKLKDTWGVGIGLTYSL